MGVHETDSWAEDVTNKLQDVALRYDYFQDKEITNLVNFLPISYDEKLAELLESWKDNASEMSSFFENYELAEDFDIPKVLGWFEDITETEKNFFWSHVADVIIYRFFETYKAHIRAHVALQFVEGINWIKQNNPDNQITTVITHSLGNIVAHDSLHMLGSNMYDEHEAFSPDDWRFQLILSLANVCGVMKSDFNPYNSIIRPTSAGAPAYFSYFAHAHHAFDPFTIPWAFSPQNWGGGFSDLILDHYHDWNIHGFEHYIDHPKVHIPLLKNLIGLDSISSSEETEAIHSYESSNQFGGNLKCIGEVKQVIDSELKPLVQSISTDTDLLDLVPLIIKSYSVYKKINDIVEACDDE